VILRIAVSFSEVTRRPPPPSMTPDPAAHRIVVRKC
jgi:hypothetical protein